MTSILMTAALAALVAAAGHDASALRHVDRVSRAFDDAQFRKDRATLDRLLAADMVYIRGSGAKAGRSEFLATFSDPAMSFDPFVITHREIVPLAPDVAAVTAEGTISGTDSGKHFTDHFRYSDIFAKRGNGWQAVYVQVTRIPAS